MSAQIHEIGGEARPSGALGLQLLKGGLAAPPAPRELTIVDIFKFGSPLANVPMTAEVRAWKRRNFGNLIRRAKKVILSKLLHLPTLYGTLNLVKISPDGRRSPVQGHVRGWNRDLLPRR